MLLTDFLEHDIQTFLDSLSIAQESTSIASQDDIKNILNLHLDDQQKKQQHFDEKNKPEIAIPSPHQLPLFESSSSSSDPNFVLPRENTSVAITFKNTGENLAEPLLNNVTSQPVMPQNYQMPMQQQMPQYQPQMQIPAQSQGYTAPIQQQTPLQPNFSTQQLRKLIHDELEHEKLSTVSKSDFNKKLSSFQHVLHDELQSYLKKLKNMTEQEEKKLIEESKHKSISIKRRPISTDERRSEITLISELEDLLLKLGSAIKNNDKAQALSLYKHIKEEGNKLTYFPSEKKYLFEQLKSKSNDLFVLLKEQEQQVVKSELTNKKIPKKVYRIAKPIVEQETQSKKLDQKVYVDKYDDIIPEKPSLSEKEVEEEVEQVKPIRSPEHNANYLRAIRAIRSKNKQEAMNILSELANQYPKSRAIKIRLMEANELDD